MFEGTSLEARKYIIGYKPKFKAVETFRWVMVGLTASGKADWRYIAEEEWREVEVPIMKTAVVMHYGKTARDHTRNVHGNRFANRVLRAKWDADMRSAGARGASRDAIKFPIEVCNGKRSHAIKISNGPQVYKT